MVEGLGADARPHHRQSLGPGGRGCALPHWEPFGLSKYSGRFRSLLLSVFPRAYANFKRLENVVAVADSVVNSIEKVEGPGTRGVKESVNDSKDEDGSDVASTLSGLLAGLPTLAGPQRLANSLRQKFASNSGRLVAVVEPVDRSRCAINESHRQQRRLTGAISQTREESSYRVVPDGRPRFQFKC
ncbi:hypothetical protein ALC56_04858 [Trachymyrmex septentrionalis]|uniref:Uncharacterized protein n=1 Tax=Trachymyrmex septentrionalis TaxID=34720 RepID=A0A195FKM7_9HYME|nr:hypothetical protein ALC56_04858 [Trachymyrmex septentrionalis]